MIVSDCIWTDFGICIHLVSLKDTTVYPCIHPVSIVYTSLVCLLEVYLHTPELLNWLRTPTCCCIHCVPVEETNLYPCIHSVSAVYTLCIRRVCILYPSCIHTVSVYYSVPAYSGIAELCPHTHWPLYTPCFRTCIHSVSIVYTSCIRHVYIVYQAANPHLTIPCRPYL